MLQAYPHTYTLDPSVDFVPNIMDRAVRYEKQRRSRINFLFAIIALAPFATREVWSLVRHDYISLSKLPWGGFLVQAYSVIMSPTAIVGFLALGFLLALFILGLPKWRVQGSYVQKA